MPWTQLPIYDALTQQPPAGMRVLSYAEALNEAQLHALQATDNVFLMGEGIDDVGGVFGSTKGLKQAFPDRVHDCPIAENALTGACAGAAMAGMRPVFIHMRSDFMLMSMDQIVNHAAKWRFMSGGQVRVPLVIRSIIGRGWGSAAQHSQGLHGLFMQIPGLKIVVPATPYDAKGLLLQAIEDDNPVLFFEHRWLYTRQGFVPFEPYTIPFGKANILRSGSDVTIVAVSQMLYEACLVADQLAKEGIQVEVIDPRTLYPLDTDTIMESVAKTGHLLIADIAHCVGGFGAEVLAKIAESDPGLLKKPATRLGFPFFPTPASPALEKMYYSDGTEMEAIIKKMLCTA